MQSTEQLPCRDRVSLHSFNISISLEWVEIKMQRGMPSLHRKADDNPVEQSPVDRMVMTAV